MSKKNKFIALKVPLFRNTNRNDTPYKKSNKQQLTKTQILQKNKSVV